jgi:hypothetical protein
MTVLLAIVPYIVLQVDRGIRAVLRGFGGVPLLIVVLLAAASVPLVMEGSRQQPISETVDGLRDGVSSLSSWVRMEGRIVTLTSPENVARGQQVQSLLVEPSGDAIVLNSHRVLDELSEVTGRVNNSANMSATAERIGGPRFPSEASDVIDRYVLGVDDPIVPRDNRNWTPVWVLVLAAAVLLVGRWLGYPVVRLRPPRVPAGVRPLAPGERLRLRAVEPENETGTRLVAPRAELRRLERRVPDDPYFSLTTAAHDRALAFRRHRWSTASAGRLWTVAESAPAVQLRDWGIEVLLALDSEADRDRLLASFLEDAGLEDG